MDEHEQSGGAIIGDGADTCVVSPYIPCAGFVPQAGVTYVSRLVDVNSADMESEGFLHHPRYNSGIIRQLLDGRLLSVFVARCRVDTASLRADTFTVTAALSRGGGCAAAQARPASMNLITPQYTATLRTLRAGPAATQTVDSALVAAVELVPDAGPFFAHSDLHANNVGFTIVGGQHRGCLADFGRILFIENPASTASIIAGITRWANFSLGDDPRDPDGVFARWRREGDNYPQCPSAVTGPLERMWQAARAGRAVSDPDIVAGLAVVRGWSAYALTMNTRYLQCGTQRDLIDQIGRDRPGFLVVRQQILGGPAPPAPAPGSFVARQLPDRGPGRMEIDGAAAVSIRPGPAAAARAPALAAAAPAAAPPAPPAPPAPAAAPPPAAPAAAANFGQAPRGRAPALIGNQYAQPTREDPARAQARARAAEAAAAADRVRRAAEINRIVAMGEPARAAAAAAAAPAAAAAAPAASGEEEATLAAVQALSATLARIGAPGLPGGTGPSYWDPASGRGGDLKRTWERTGGGMPRQDADGLIEASLYIAQRDPRGRQSRVNSYLEVSRLWNPSNVPDEDVRRAGDTRANVIYFETQRRGRRLRLNGDQIDDAMVNAQTGVLIWELVQLGLPLALPQRPAAPAAAAAAAGAPAVAMLRGDVNGYPRDLVDQWIRDGIRVIGDSAAAEGAARDRMSETIGAHNLRGAELAAIVEREDANAFGYLMDRVLAVERYAADIAELRGTSRLNARTVAAYVRASAEAWEYDRWVRTRRRRGGARKRTTRRKRRSS